ncbi:G-protein coupled receptor family C group 5 member C isoform X2 [Dunckerocampus dactyliophorus]|uniref:G-protein coupled receptor family C group 5 member C isoform X2 n=1 Tax=Dunckerocampus dactyliophorus TaxID=161453 RepID=UPI002405ACF4|nr:G-protein coupled receptor family C group 5 member C isoform X2 [Dunckerocampus dactyliophorus]
MAANVSRPEGCGVGVDSIYYNLCDLASAWGVVLEALAAAGVVFSFVLFIAVLANVPFTQDRNRRNSVALHAIFLVCTAGLFGLTFAFIVGKDFSTCASRRFLFGVLFAGCLSCLLVQGVRLNILARTNSAPPAWTSCLGALALGLVEVVINTEWLIITVVRHPLAPLNSTKERGEATATPCNIANQDFAMALIYVMVLLLAVVAASVCVMAGKHKQWKAEGALILVSAVFSVGIWVAWIVMYIYGNRGRGGPSWDDPTLAIALVANAWVFLIFLTIPQVCCLQSGGGSDFGEDSYPSRGVGYETILKEQNPQNVFMENKAFSMEEPVPASKPVSPYSGYTGQLRSSVYQPTELALITKASTNPPDTCYDTAIPRVSAHFAADSISSTPSQHGDKPSAVYLNGSGGNVLHRTSQW